MVLRRLLREHHGQQEIKWNENEEQRDCTKLGGFDRGGKETAVEPFGDFSTRRLCRHCCNVVVSVERNGVVGRVVEELRGFTGHDGPVMFVGGRSLKTEKKISGRFSISGRPSIPCTP